MLLIDVNVLVYAHRADAIGHEAFYQWLSDVDNGDRAYGISDLVLSGFLRIVTHPQLFNPPINISDLLAFNNQVRQQSNCIRVAPGPRH